MAFSKITIDLETENVAPKPLHSSSPHWELNYIVAAGIYYSSGMSSSFYSGRYEPTDYTTLEMAIQHNEEHDDSMPIFIGQNLKFDLLYLLKDPKSRQTILNWYSKGGTIWDTMQVEYLLSAQSKMFPSLDYLSLQYGLPLKDDKIKEYWEDGVPTSKIPKDELMEYMEQDVMNTHAIYEKQAEKVKELGMERFVMAQMEALLATLMMEWHGMHFDVGHAAILEKGLTESLDEIKARTVKRIQNLTKTTKLPIEWNPASPVQLSRILYGGVIKYKEEEEVKALDGSTARYKSGPNKGKIKYKKVEKHHLTKQPKWVDEYLIVSKSTSTGTGEEVLKSMLEFLESNPTCGLGNPWKELLGNLLEFRKIHKELNTYVKGYSEYAETCGGKIHPNYNHAATATGRLSCSNPNLQNVTRGK